MTPPISMHLHPALDEFEHRVAKIGNRYQVSLLIKESCFSELADNRTIAEARLFSQLRRLRDQPHLMQQYHDTISEYFSEGHAEEVLNTSSLPPNLDYLPHHAVIRQDAVTTKVRVVFDASSHMPAELSLNQVLHKGPNLNADLLVQLISFRCHPVVLIAGIRKAYLQIAIRPEDRDALRFLWIKKLPSPQEPLPDIQEWRMTRVPFSASSRPFLLAATLRHHPASAADRYPATTESLKHSFYVDDHIVGATSDDDAFRLYQDAVSILAEAGMELRKWASSSPTMNSQFLQDCLAYDNVSTQPMIKVLELLWHRPTDEITFDVGSVVVYIADHPVTKRTPRTSPYIRPLGYLTPFTTSARLLFQSLWSLGYGWDSPLAPQQRSGWTEWCSLYLRTTASQGQWNCSLLIRKGRVAPLETISLPRLELIGCHAAARLAAHSRQLSLLTSLPTYFWTDSTIAFHWITANLPFRPAFLQHRVTEIKRLSTGHTWRHCPADKRTPPILSLAVCLLRDSPPNPYGGTAHTGSPCRQTPGLLGPLQASLQSPKMKNTSRRPLSARSLRLPPRSATLRSATDQVAGYFRFRPLRQSKHGSPDHRLGTLLRR
ncbi:uncharacterized protein LOC135389514 [Ornithodoros turicata]|uniref:uncharacterized protein LOC135389514 n=1 Tax=Ornithodoros turicata TaxID=34597 RepID=UPI00313968FE